jgi:DNA primase large subunit
MQYQIRGTDEFHFPFELVFPYISVAGADVRGGQVIVKAEDLRPMFIQFFEKFLQRKLEKYIADRIPEREVFRAVVSLFLDTLEVGQDHRRVNLDQIALRDLDVLASRSFPPCMYGMFKQLRKTHKLFHEGRLQLGLFLKGLGLSLSDSLAFWRSELSQIVGESGFDKQYAYNIRYNYGKEGSAKSRTAYSCLGIIRHPAPAATQTHGCPFMQWGVSQCTALLRTMEREQRRAAEPIDHNLVSVVVDKGQKHPQIACRDWYNLLHRDQPMDAAPQQPADWFAVSEDALRPPE